MKIYLNIFLFFFCPLAFATNEEISKELVKLSIDVHKEKFLALNFQVHPGWHIYWKNPGDAGLPIAPTFSLNDMAFELIGLEWPAPESYIEQEGGILSYGYE